MEDIDSLIIARLGEHQRKTDFINRSLKARAKRRAQWRRTAYWTSFAAAACIAAVLMVSPMLSRDDGLSGLAVSAPSFGEYRGAGLYLLQSQLDSSRYNEALMTVDTELADIDCEISTSISEQMSADESAYTMALYQGEKEALLWAKIYILVKLDKKSQLVDACQNYLKCSDFTEHREEVEKILKIIQ